MKIVQVEFDQTPYKHYEFKCGDETVNLGDYVVVDTSVGIGVAKVVGFKEVSKLATRWVIQKVDMTKHEERLEREKKMKEVKAKMEARRKKLQEREIYILLAKEDDEMANLLKEYEELGA